MHQASRASRSNFGAKEASEESRTVAEMVQTLRAARRSSSSFVSNLKPEPPKPVPCACAVPALHFSMKPSASACRSFGMGAFDSFSAFTKSGAYWSSSGAMKVMAVPLLPARPASQRRRDAAEWIRV